MNPLLLLPDRLSAKDDVQRASQTVQTETGWSTVVSHRRHVCSETHMCVWKAVHESKNININDRCLHVHVFCSAYQRRRRDVTDGEKCNDMSVRGSADNGRTRLLMQDQCMCASVDQIWKSDAEQKTGSFTRRSYVDMHRMRLYYNYCCYSSSSSCRFLEA